MRSGKRRVGELLIMRAVRSLSRSERVARVAAGGLGALVGLGLNHGRRGLLLHWLVYRLRTGGRERVVRDRGHVYRPTPDWSSQEFNLILN